MGEREKDKDSASARPVRLWRRLIKKSKIKIKIKSKIPTQPDMASFWEDGKKDRQVSER